MGPAVSLLKLPVVLLLKPLRAHNRRRMLGGQARTAHTQACLDSNGAGAWLIVGLGNPGQQYKNNRHNVGFHMVDELAEREGVAMGKQAHNALVGNGFVWGHRVYLAKPQTYMNESGRAVSKLLRFYKIPPERLLVAYDDLDLPAAAVRLRAKGSHGGHNGMRSIMQHLGGARDFPRIRIGIGRPPGRMPVVDYVLQDFSRAEAADMAAAIDEGIAMARTVLVEGLERALSGVRT